MNSQPEDTQTKVNVKPPEPVSKPAKGLVVSENPSLTTYRAHADILKYPRHILAKTSKGKRETDIRIGEKKKDHSYWWITPNPKYGIPGELSFRVDNFNVQPKIDEAIRKAKERGEKVSRYVVGGYLTDIAKQVGRGTSGEDLRQVRKAIESNAATTIECNAVIRTNGDGEVEYLTGLFHPYDVYFRGNKLPDGTEVEKVIYVLSDPFLQAANSQEYFKPVDIEYLKQLGSTGAQRWYLYMSARLFGVLIHRGDYAKVRYSEYCEYHPQKRHTAFSHMQRQMTNLHQKHVEFEYIEPPQYQETRDANDQKDWWIFYKPSTKAKQEYQQNRQRRITKPAPKELPETDPSQDAYNLVAYFQKQKNNQDMYSPTAKELKQAAELSSKHGLDRAKKIVGLAINEMAKSNFNAIYFGAVLQYENQAIETLELKEQQDQQVRENQKAEHEAQVNQYQEWLKLTPEERIKAKLDFKIFGHQLKQKRPPDESQIKQWQQELIEAIPTPEEYQMQLFGRIIFSI